MKHNYHAITLDKKNISEADRLYTFYTLENGLMRVPARGVRKGRSKLAPQVEDFVLSHVSIAKNYGRGTLAGAIAENYFSHLRTNYDALACVDVVRKILLTIMHENDRDEKVFMLLVEYLEQLDVLVEKKVCDVVTLQWITHAFLIKFFSLQGYDFYTGSCCICSGKIIEAKHGFSASSGGVLCEKCSCNEYFCYIDPDTLKALRAIQTNELRSLSKLIVHEDVYRQLSRVVNNIEQWVMR